MEERIVENIEREAPSPEQVKGGEKDIFESKGVAREKTEQLDKGAVLRDIYSQPTIEEKKEQPKFAEEDKRIDNFVKESRFGSGMEKVVNVIRKMKCFIGEKAHILDGVHDRYKQKNGNKDKQL